MLYLMIGLNNNFDPISLISDSGKQQLSQNSTEQLKKELTIKIWDYLTIKLSQDLTEQQLEEVFNAVGFQQRANVLKKYIPDFDQKVEKYLEEFKAEFKKGEEI